MHFPQEYFEALWELVPEGEGQTQIPCCYLRLAKLEIKLKYFLRHKSKA